MAVHGHEKVFELMDGPRRTTVQPFVSGDSVVASIDSDFLEKQGITTESDDIPDVDQWIHEDKGIIVLDFDP